MSLIWTAFFRKENQASRYIKIEKWPIGSSSRK